MDIYNYSYQLSYNINDTEDIYYQTDLLSVFNIPLNTDEQDIYDIFDDKIKLLYNHIKDNDKFIQFLNKYKDDYYFIVTNDYSEYLSVFFEFNLFYKTHELLHDIFMEKN